jgi:hypothetical protein
LYFSRFVRSIDRAGHVSAIDAWGARSSNEGRDKKSDPDDSREFSKKDHIRKFYVTRQKAGPFAQKSEPFTSKIEPFTQKTEPFARFFDQLFMLNDCKQREMLETASKLPVFFKTDKQNYPCKMSRPDTIPFLTTA